MDWAALDCVVVGEASNGAQALEAVERYDPSLIITDLKMPVMDGLEMLRQLRERGNNAFVIILTAYDSFSYAQTALRLGAQSAVGVDIDPKAEDIARENAAYNCFGSPAFTALTGNVTEDKALMHRLSQDRYDLLLVNIVADVIIGLSPILPDFMGEHTLLICSGILDSRLDDVTAALEKAGLTVTEIRAKEEWRCVLAKREGGIS